jgi:hypothetical protein
MMKPDALLILVKRDRVTGVFSFDFELIQKTYLRNVGDISVGSVYLQ